MQWKILMIVGIILLVIVVIIIIYASAIAKKDGKISDPIYADIAYAAKPAGNILKNLKDQNRSAVCRVSRGFSGIHIDVASSGDPPIHYEKDIIMKANTTVDIAELLDYTASDIAHFAGEGFHVMKEFGDSYLVERSVHY